MKYQEIIQLLENKAKTLDKGQKLSLKDVSFLCNTLVVSEPDQVKIVNSLEDKGILETPKGYASMSSLQLKIHRFINESMLGQLMDEGKCKLVVTEDDLKSLLEEDKGEYYVLNKKGDLIKPSCNNTNVTQARKVREIKAMQEQISK